MTGLTSILIHRMIPPELSSLVKYGFSSILRTLFCATTRMDRWTYITSKLEGWVGTDGASGGVYAVVSVTASLPTPLLTCNSACSSNDRVYNQRRKIKCKSTLLKGAKRDKKFWLVSADAIHGPAMVIDNLGKRDTDDNSLIVVEPRERWPKLFIDMA
jgi:hypothetical protein